MDVLLVRICWHHVASLDILWPPMTTKKESYTKSKQRSWQSERVSQFMRPMIYRFTLDSRVILWWLLSQVTLPSQILGFWGGRTSHQSRCQIQQRICGLKKFQQNKCNVQCLTCKMCTNYLQSVENRSREWESNQIICLKKMMLGPLPIEALRRWGASTGRVARCTDRCTTQLK